MVKAAILRLTHTALQEGAGGFEMPFPGGLMMPGGPMMPPDFMAMAMGGMAGGPMMPPRPRPPPGPPPSGPSPGNQLASPERDGNTLLFPPWHTARYGVQCLLAENL